MVIADANYVFAAAEPSNKARTQLGSPLQCSVWHARLVEKAKKGRQQADKIEGASFCSDEHGATRMDSVEDLFIIHLDLISEGRQNLNAWGLHEFIFVLICYKIGRCSLSTTIVQDTHEARSPPRSIIIRNEPGHHLRNRLFKRGALEVGMQPSEQGT